MAPVDVEALVDVELPATVPLFAAASVGTSCVVVAEVCAK